MCWNRSGWMYRKDTEPLPGQGIPEWHGGNLTLCGWACPRDERRLPFLPRLCSTPMQTAGWPVSSVLRPGILAGLLRTVPQRLSNTTCPPPYSLPSLHHFCLKKHCQSQGVGVMDLCVVMQTWPLIGNWLGRMELGNSSFLSSSASRKEVCNSV